MGDMERYVYEGNVALLNLMKKKLPRCLKIRMRT